MGPFWLLLMSNVETNMIWQHETNQSIELLAKKDFRFSLHSKLYTSSKYKKTGLCSPIRNEFHVLYPILTEKGTFLSKEILLHTSQKGRICQKIKSYKIHLSFYSTWDVWVRLHYTMSSIGIAFRWNSSHDINKKTYSTHFQKAALRVSINRMAITWQVCQFLSKRLPNQPALHKPFQSEKLVKWQHLQSVE